jgi:hypothetical protein
VSTWHTCRWRVGVQEAGKYRHNDPSWCTSVTIHRDVYLLPFMITTADGG